MNTEKKTLHIAPKFFCYFIIFISLVRLVYYAIESLGNNPKLMFLYFIAWIVFSAPFIMVIKMRKLGLYILVIISLLFFFSGAFGDEFIYKNFGPEAATIILFTLLQIGGENSFWKRMK